MFTSPPEFLDFFFLSSNFCPLWISVFQWNLPMIQNSSVSNRIGINSRHFHRFISRQGIWNCFPQSLTESNQILSGGSQLSVYSEKKREFSSRGWEMTLSKMQANKADRFCVFMLTEPFAGFPVYSFISFYNNKENKCSHSYIVFNLHVHL